MNTEERHAQTMSALRQGNIKKSARAALKRRVRAGDLPISTVITVAPEILRTSSYKSRTVTLAEILAWQPGWGIVKAEKFLTRLGISPALELHALSVSRRKMLAARLH